VIPKDGLAPGLKMGIADSAYVRTIDELRDMLYLPVKLPENGDNPRVIFFPSFVVCMPLI
jgi:hypothetical protein